MEVFRFDSILQVIHLALRDLFNRGESPLLGQCDPEGTHGIEGLYRSTTSLQIERDGTVHLVGEVIPRERCLADDKRNTLKVRLNQSL